MEKIHQKAKLIRLAVFDIDGVLTDGKLLFDQQGREYKTFHARDGHGIKLLRKSGVQVAIISGRRSEAVALRMKNLGIEHVYQGYEDKLPVFNRLCEKLSITPEQVAHVGDDLPDLPIMRKVGLAIAVQDAHFSIVEHAHWQTKLPGGCGAAREVCDLIMQAQGTLTPAIESYL